MGVNDLHVLSMRAALEPCEVERGEGCDSGKVDCNFLANSAEKERQRQSMKSKQIKKEKLSNHTIC